MSAAAATDEEPQADGGRDLSTVSILEWKFGEVSKFLVNQAKSHEMVEAGLATIESAFRTTAGKAVVVKKAGELARKLGDDMDLADYVFACLTDVIIDQYREAVLAGNSSTADKLKSSAERRDTPLESADDILDRAQRAAKKLRVSDGTQERFTGVDWLNQFVWMTQSKVYNLREFDIPPNFRVSTLDIQYVQPPIFGSILDGVRKFEADARNGKKCEMQFVEGGSGCGKTRLAFEIAKALGTEKELVYLSVDMRTAAVANLSKPPRAPEGESPTKEDKQAAADWGMSFLLSKILKHLANIGDAAVPDGLTIHDALNYMASEMGMEVLYVNLDEIQEDSYATACLLRTICLLNSEGHLQLIVVPVGTGLMSPGHFSGLVPPTFGSAQTWTLPFFEVQTDSSRFAAKDPLFAFVAATLTVFNVMMSAPSFTDGLDALLFAHLLTDTGGWSYALMELGTVLGMTGHALGTEMLRFQRCEEVEKALIGRILKRYPPKSYLTQFGTTEDGLVKLLLLTLSGLKVREDERINGATLKTVQKTGLVCLSDERISMAMALKAGLCQLDHCVETGYFPPPDVFSTFRASYYGEPWEQAHTYSLMASFNAVKALDANKGALTIELAKIRPGAHVITVNGGTNTLPMASCLTFNDSRMPLTDLASCLIEHGSRAMAGLFTAGEYALDGWAWFPAEDMQREGCLPKGTLILMQSKGKQSGEAVGRKGLDGPMSHSAKGGLKDFVAKLIDHVDNVRTRGPADVSLWQHITVIFELITASNVTHVEDTPEKLESYMQEALGTRPGTLVFVSRNELKDAMGPTFGGMITRFEDINMGQGGQAVEEVDAGAARS